MNPTNKPAQLDDLHNLCTGYEECGRNEPLCTTCRAAALIRQLEAAVELKDEALRRAEKLLVTLPHKFGAESLLNNRGGIRDALAGPTAPPVDVNAQRRRGGVA